MSTTDTRSGFRLPWSSDRPRDDAAPAEPAGAVAEAVAADADPTPVLSDGSEIGPDGSWPDVDVNARLHDDDGSGPPNLASDRQETAVSEPLVTRTPAVVTPRKPSRLMAELVTAMRSTAEVAREQAQSQLEADARQVVEDIRKGSTEGTAALRQRSDEDIARIREWSKAEIARVREETDHRVTGRKELLETEIAAHAAAIDRRVGEVQAAVTAYETEMAAFFERLLGEDDPARLATMAESMPEPPSLATLTDSDGVSTAAEAATSDDRATEPEKASGIATADDATEADAGFTAAEAAAAQAQAEAVEAEAEIVEAQVAAVQAQAEAVEAEAAAVQAQAEAVEAEVAAVQAQAEAVEAEAAAVAGEAWDEADLPVDGTSAEADADADTPGVAPAADPTPWSMEDGLSADFKETRWTDPDEAAGLPGDAGVEDAESGDPAVARWTAGSGDGSTAEAGSPVDRGSIMAALEAAAEAVVAAEAAAESADQAEAAADVAETAAELIVGRVDTDEETEHEAEAALAARMDAGGFDREPSLADRLASLLPGAGSAEADAAPTTTQVVVTGLVSVASIASFKRHVGRAHGVQSVTVASGPDGEFVFNVTHRTDAGLRDAIPALPGFGARVTGTGDGVLNVAARDPEAEG